MLLIDTVLLRWNFGHQKNSLTYWHSMHHWLSGEARIAISDQLPQTAEMLSTLSRLAYQHMLDLEPVSEGVAA